MDPVVYLCKRDPTRVRGHAQRSERCSPESLFPFSFVRSVERTTTNKQKRSRCVRRRWFSGKVTRSRRESNIGTNGGTVNVVSLCFCDAVSVRNSFQQWNPLTPLHHADEHLFPLFRTAGTSEQFRSTSVTTIESVAAHDATSSAYVDYSMPKARYTSFGRVSISSLAREFRKSFPKDTPQGTIHFRDGESHFRHTGTKGSARHMGRVLIIFVDRQSSTPR